MGSVCHLVAAPASQAALSGLGSRWPKPAAVMPENAMAADRSAAHRISKLPC
jgi:hypothetical protein